MSTTTDISGFNNLSYDIAYSHFLRCCGSRNFATQMANKLPFSSFEALLVESDCVWWALEESDWKEAFAAHPRIGDKESLRKKFAHSDWEKQEQKEAEGASEEILEELERANVEYEEKFGHVFLICATGKTAIEMLSELHRRYPNSPETEIRVAAGEQEKITHLRLLRLLPTLTNIPSKL